MGDEGQVSPLIKGLITHYERLRNELHPQQIGRTKAAINTELEAIEADLAAFVTPALASIAHDPAVSDTTRNAFQTLLTPEHQSQLVIVAAAAYALVREFVSAAIAPYVQEVSNTAWSAPGNQVVPLSPSILATAVLKGVMDQGAAAKLAALSGYDATNFGWLVQAEGQSIGLEEALLLLRRNQITAEQFKQIEQYSNLNPLFYGMAQLLQYQPPTAGEAIMGAVKGHLTDAEAQQHLAVAGIDPSNYQWLKDSAGRPIGLMEALSLWNRGAITEADVDTVIRQSDINPNFLDIAKLLRVTLPPTRSVVPMVRSGALSEADARTLLAQHGLPQLYVDTYIKEAQQTGASAVKEIPAGQVVKLYEEQLITEAAATTRLTALKYAPDAIVLLLQSADHARINAALNAGVTNIRSRYVGRKIDKPTATADLGALQVPATAVATLMGIWDTERAANVHMPPVAVVLHAWVATVITAAQCKARLLALGVELADLEVVASMAWPVGKVDRAALAALASA